MKQHLAKSLLMAGAMIASYPLLAQQAQPVQQVQPMPATQPLSTAQPTQSVQSAPAYQTAPATVAQQPAAANPYAQGSMESVQMGVPPAPGAATAAPAPGVTAMAPPPGAAVDPASMTLAPDALGTRLGRRNPYLDGA